MPQIANAAITVITEQNQPIFPQNGNEPVQVVVLDQPVVKSTVEGDDGLPLGRRFQLLLRTAVGLLVGGLFVLLAHFFDPFLHSGQDVLNFTRVGSNPKIDQIDVADVFSRICSGTCPTRLDFIVSSHRGGWQRVYI